MTRVKPPRFWLTILFFVGLLGYGAYQARNVARGPQLQINEPENGLVAEDDLIHVRGNAANISRLYLNGRQIFSDNMGRFDEEVLLAYGYNVLEVRAEDQFGRETQKSISLILK